MAAPGPTTARPDDAPDAISDAELERLALAASDHELPDDAVAWDLSGRTPLIADWYRPAPAGLRRDLRTRVVAGAVLASILAINAAGLCVTYGTVILG